MNKNWELKDVSYFHEETGTLSVVEYGQSIEFEVKRVFTLNRFTKNSIRGNHAHKKLKQLIICSSGSFDIELDDGKNKKTLTLSDNGKCLFLRGMVWRVMRNFTKDCVITVLCDREYRLDSVINCYDKFIEMSVLQKENEY